MTSILESHKGFEFRQNGSETLRFFMVLFVIALGCFAILAGEFLLGIIMFLSAIVIASIT